MSLYREGDQAKDSIRYITDKSVKILHTIFDEVGVWIHISEFRMMSIYNI